MKTVWEYKVVPIPAQSSARNDNLEIRLNRFGQDGWELACIKGEQIIFKRPSLQKPSEHPSLPPSKSPPTLCSFKDTLIELHQVEGGWMAKAQEVGATVGASTRDAAIDLIKQAIDQAKPD